ncbi:MAG: hypothetical protein ACYCXW_22585 [Solirubrobacteraceae bacterium]
MRNGSAGSGTHGRSAEPYEAFVAKYADPELWDGHKKTITIPSISPGERDLGVVHRTIQLLVEAGQVLDGLTVAEVLERARTSLGLDVELQLASAEEITL